MSTEDTSPDTSPKSTGGSGGIARIVLIVVLIVALVGLFVDIRARNAAADLDTQLQDLLEKAPARQKPTIEEVHKITGGEPSNEYELEGVAETKVEEYSYQGALRKYVVYCAYSTRDGVRLDAVQQNKEFSKEDF